MGVLGSRKAAKARRGRVSGVGSSLVRTSPTPLMLSLSKHGSVSSHAGGQPQEVQCFDKLSMSGFGGGFSKHRLRRDSCKFRAYRTPSFRAFAPLREPAFSWDCGGHAVFVAGHPETGSREGAKARRGRVSGVGSDSPQTSPNPLMLSLSKHGSVSSHAGGHTQEVQCFDKLSMSGVGTCSFRFSTNGVVRCSLRLRTSCSTPFRAFAPLREPAFSWDCGGHAVFVAGHPETGSREGAKARRGLVSEVGSDTPQTSPNPLMLSLSKHGSVSSHAGGHTQEVQCFDKLSMSGVGGGFSKHRLRRDSFKFLAYRIPSFRGFAPLRETFSNTASNCG
jgi:hypothetical protein